MSELVATRPMAEGIVGQFWCVAYAVTDAPIGGADVIVFPTDKGVPVLLPSRTLLEAHRVKGRWTYVHRGDRRVAEVVAEWADRALGDVR